MSHNLTRSGPSASSQPLDSQLTVAEIPRYTGRCWTYLGVLAPLWRTSACCRKAMKNVYISLVGLDQFGTAAAHPQQGLEMSTSKFSAPPAQDQIHAISCAVVGIGASGDTHMVA